MKFDLYNEDCFDTLRSTPNHSVDLVLIDPPYNITTIDWDKALDLNFLWKELDRVVKPSGCVLIFGVGIFTAKVILSNEKDYKQTLVWNKNKCGSPALAKIRPMQVTEDIIVFAKGRTVYNPQMEIGEPFTRKAKTSKGYVSRCNTHGYGMKPVTEIVNKGTRYPKNILNISRDFSAQQQVHPTQKPVALMEYLIKTYSNEGDTVADWYMGSGPVGVACVNTDRNYIGVEIDKSSFDIAKQRIELAYANK